MTLLIFRVPTRKLHLFPLFNACPNFKNCPPARNATAANSFGSDFNIFRMKTIVLRFYVTFIFISWGVIANNLSALLFSLFVFFHVLFIVPFYIVFVCYAVTNWPYGS